MRKIGAIVILLLFIGASFLSGCVDQKSDDGDNGDDTPATIVVTDQEAFDILMDEILDPSSSDEQVSSFMLSEMLEPGDVITSDSGETYTIDDYTWFIFIDDMPWAFYGHPTRYVFINAETGEKQIIEEYFPPEINNYSMWDSANHNRGDVTESYPILNKSQPIATDVSTGAPHADYGDAPDTQNAFVGITGAFPTLYNTTNSRVDYPGGHTLTIDEETLGVTVSAEVDANDPNDPDLVPNLVDSDKDERMYVNLNLQSGQLSFTVSVNASAPDVPRYVNVLIDFDQNGSWMEGNYGTEWVVVNYDVNVSPGETKTITTPSFAWSNQTILPSPCWMRVALTRAKVNETLFSTVGGWDGSGRFEYGEIEDHIVYLTDDTPDPDDEWPPWPEEPPTGGDPDPQPPGGGPQPPGPTTGPCGTTVNYHCIVINGGDSSSHLRKGQNPAEQGVDKVTDLVDDQGYNTVASLGPGGNSMSAIAQAFADLKSAVQCGDHVLIYIIGHGKPASKGGGVTLRGTDGKTDETMKPQDLADLLGTIPPCPDEDCDEPGKCCHVTVILESCYAGNFNTPGVTGTGRTIIGSCDDEPADATGGGTFTNGFVDASNSEDSDADDSDSVEPGEAFDEAADGVDNNNAATGRSQEPWIDSQECECKCPCSPSIDVDKWAWDDSDWVEEMDTYLGAEVLFAIDVENDGVCRNVSDLEIVDTLPSCLSYGEDASVLFTDSEGIQTELAIMPLMADTPDGGMSLTFDLGSEIGLFAPGELISIEYSATTMDLDDNTNVVNASALCTYDPSRVVEDSDSATVNVLEEPTDYIAEDIMSTFLSGYGECFCSGEECSGTLVITSFGAEDLSGGDHPITNVILEVNGVEKFNSGAISTTLYNNSIDIPVSECEVPYTVEVTATNALGLDLTYSDSITPELILSVHIYTNINYTVNLDTGECLSAAIYTDFEAIDLTGGTYPIESVILNGGSIVVDQSLPAVSFLQQINEEVGSCEGTYTYEMTVTNSKGHILEVSTDVILSPPEI